VVRAYRNDYWRKRQGGCMKPRELELLRRIAEAPRTLHQMTMHRRITAPTIARIGWVRRAGR
jgi:hypothetical protein